MGIAMPEGGGYSKEAVRFDIETRKFHRLPNLDGLYSCRPFKDGRRAVCRAGDEGEIVVADLQSGARTVLLGKDEVRDLETWSAAPSREWLCLLRRHQQRELYLVELE